MVENAVFLTSFIIVYKELCVQHMIVKQQFAYEQLLSLKIKFKFKFKNSVIKIPRYC